MEILPSRAASATQETRRVPLIEGFNSSDFLTVFSSPFLKPIPNPSQELPIIKAPGDMDESQPSRSVTSYTARLDRTLKLLQDRVKEQEAVLEKARISS